MSRIVIWILIGGGIGAALGYFGQCSTGTCPLTANWKRGALFGVVFALIFYFSSGMPSGGDNSAEVSSPHVKKIAESEFEAEVLKATTPVVVDFYADWCGPCRRLSPRLASVADRLGGQVKVIKVNVDNAPALSRKYGISGIPALKFFKDGRESGGLVGLVSEQELETQLRGLVPGAPGAH